MSRTIEIENIENDWIADRMKARGFEEIRELAEFWGLKHGTVLNLAHKKSISASFLTVEQIARKEGISSADVFKKLKGDD